jgi:hypothetical protein
LGIQSTLPDVQWNSILSEANFVGRTWLNDEIAIAIPLLSVDELARVNQGLTQPVFPEDLAKLIAAKAAEAALKGTLSDNVRIQESAESACKNESWSNCGVAVKREIEQNSANPKRVIELSILWGQSFNAQYRGLRHRGHLEQSTPDDERVEEILNAHLNPFEIAKDHAQDAILKSCLGRLGFVVEWSGLPPVAAILTFFENSPEAASDFDELLLMDSAIQEEVGKQLQPLMLPTWNTDLNAATTQSAVQWMSPK